jgi:nitroimidazol reductase NimA-like FMN-containing flavoprotein (pyridoxamine 5'-phosphate oxidase superfamily)
MHGESNPQLLELTREECLALLASADVGRLAVNVPDWPPLIRPVSYAFDEPSKSVVFRTGRGSKFHALTHAQRAAFEIDGHEPAGQTGWSVIVVGAVEEITNPAELSRLDQSRLRSWVAGDAHHWMRIRATSVSGRRISPS